MTSFYNVNCGISPRKEWLIGGIVSFENVPSKEPFIGYWQMKINDSLLLKF